MQMKLYNDDVQARRVTLAAREALATASDETQQYPRGYQHIAPQAWASAICITSHAAMLQYNALLRQRASALVEVPCRRYSIPIQMLGEYPLFTGLKLVHSAASDVVIVPADQDPLLASGTFPLPRQVRQRLQAMERAGVPFDMMYTYVAHEVPPYSVSKEGPLPLEVVLPPAPASTVQTSERLGKVAHAATTTFLAGLGRATTSGMRGVGIAGMAVGAAALTLLDPLIFGAIADERGMATWFVLAQWVW